MNNLRQPRGERLPETVLRELIDRINAVFYAKATARQWLQDQKPIMAALTWPAEWMRQRGVDGLSVERYEAILREILNTIARHGRTQAIKHFPTYLMHCVRQHFVYHGEDLLLEQKRIRTALDLRFLQGLPARTAQTRDTPSAIDTIATAHRMLAAAGRRRKTAFDEQSAPSLFRL